MAIRSVIKGEPALLLGVHHGRTSEVLVGHMAEMHGKWPMAVCLIFLILAGGFHLAYHQYFLVPGTAQRGVPLKPLNPPLPPKSATGYGENMLPTYIVHVFSCMKMQAILEHLPDHKLKTTVQQLLENDIVVFLTPW